VLHFNDSSGEADSNDALYKIRPVLNVLKKTLGSYIIPGDDLALDESSFACRTKYGRLLIFYNPTKPGGKYHFRFYLICDCSTYAILRLRVHTRNTSDVADGLNPVFDTVVPDVEEVTEEKINEDTDDEDDDEPVERSKINDIILDMSKPYHNTGRTITFDNYYGGPVPLIDMKNHGVLARCTHRLNRMHSCKFIKMTKTDAKKYPRGSYRVAVNKEHNMCAYGWLDGNPVHLLSTADGTGTSKVLRQIGRTKQQIPAPKALPRYNMSMQAVDRVDQLMQLMSLCKRHQFKKWYRQFFLALLDMALVNADIYCHFANPSEKKKSFHRYNFFNALGTALVETNWQKYCLQKRTDLYNTVVSQQVHVTADKRLLRDLGVPKQDFVSPSSPSKKCKSIKCEQCNPIDIRSYFTNCKLSHRRLFCQICLFEGRGRKLKSVALCAQHQVRACLKSYPNSTANNIYIDPTKGRQVCTDWSWVCPNKTLTCWEKLHQFYIPNKLFMSANADISPQNFSSVNIKTGSLLQKKIRGYGIGRIQQ